MASANTANTKKTNDRARELVEAFVRKHDGGGGCGGCQTPRVDLLTIWSTTMWVHLAHGDEGLKRLLLYVIVIMWCD